MLKEVKVVRRRKVASPVIVLDEFFRLDEWSPADAAAHRRFALDSDAARFFVDGRAGGIGAGFALPRSD
jgi:hypothetical protein